MSPNEDQSEAYMDSTKYREKVIKIQTAIDDSEKNLV